MKVARRFVPSLSAACQHTALRQTGPCPSLHCCDSATGTKTGRDLFEPSLQRSIPWHNRSIPTGTRYKSVSDIDPFSGRLRESFTIFTKNCGRSRRRCSGLTAMDTAWPAMLKCGVPDGLGDVLPGRGAGIEDFASGKIVAPPSKLLSRSADPHPTRSVDELHPARWRRCGRFARPSRPAPKPRMAP